MTHTKPARGMRDFLPADVRRRAHVIGIVTEVYQRYGFEPLETPAVENLETLMGKYGEEGNQLIFRVMKRGQELQASIRQTLQGFGESLAARWRVIGDDAREEALREVLSVEPQPAAAAVEDRLAPLRSAARDAAWRDIVGEAGTVSGGDFADLALRYDLTVPLARVVAEYRGLLPKFFKRYQIQPVWRADRPSRGRFREFYQCDVDVLGSTSVIVEAELCAAVSEVLTRLGFQDFVIRMNHRQVLSAMLTAAGVPVEKSGDALVALDKLDKIGRDGVQQEFAQRGIDAAAAVKLLDLFQALSAAGASAEASGPDGRDSLNTRTLGTLADFIGASEAGAAALDDLRTILRYAAATPARSRIAIDASLARGLSYYTGAIMEIAVPDLAGSLGGGGRYDNLVGMFLGPNQAVPACGFSLGLERIIVVMTERKMFPEGLDAAPADVMVTLWNADRVPDALALAAELRAAGLRADVYPEADKIGKQFKYAASRGIPKVAILGDDEVAAGEVAIKDMSSGEQTRVARQAVAAVLRPSA